MKFYDQHNEIFFKKDVSSLSSKEGLDLYNPHMVNKYASLKDPYWAVLVNYSTNKYWSVLNDKLMHAKCISGCMPKDRKVFITYPFKKKEKTDIVNVKETNAKIKMLADALELSIREVEDYLERSDIDIHKIIPS